MALATVVPPIRGDCEGAPLLARTPSAVLARHSRLGELPTPRRLEPGTVDRAER
jgi:hypothetical protein